MSLESQNTDDAAFGAGFNIDDDDTGKKPTVAADSNQRPNGSDNNPNASSSDDVDYKALYEQQKADREAAEARYTSLQGKYNAEVPRLNTRVKELESRAPVQQPSATIGNDDTATDGGDDSDLPEEAKELLRDMPTVSKAVDALVRHRTKSLVRQQVETAVKPINDRMTPLVEQSAKTAEAEHFGAIAKAHADWNTVVNGDPFKGWVGKLPSYRRGPVEQILKEGDAQSVVEVLSDFKKESGYQSPAESSGEDDLAVVGRRSGGPRAGAQADGNANDFAAGFNMD